MKLEKETVLLCMTSFLCIKHTSALTVAAL